MEGCGSCCAAGQLVRSTTVSAERPSTSRRSRAGRRPGGRVMETLTDGLEAAQIMRRVEQLLGARQFVRFQEPDLQAVQELLLLDRGHDQA